MFRFRTAKAGNGVAIDEIDGMTPDQVKLLIDRGLVYCTSFREKGAPAMGNIIAASEESAEHIAAERGLGEEIIGILVSGE